MINISEKEKKDFLNTETNTGVLLAGIILTVIYFAVITFMFPMGNKVIFAFLIAGEVFHVFQVLMYISTVWQTEYFPKRNHSYAPPVDVFITVAGEPVEVVEETVVAAKAMNYPNFRVYILNDGFVAKKDNWQEMIDLAKKYGIGCVTRSTPGGAKAGNINNAINETAVGADGKWLPGGSLIVILDSDHVPHEDFLEKTVPYFSDQKVAFVQSPQFYKNYMLNYVTKSAWEQQELFFGPICKGKNRLNSATMCGTNMVIRRDALVSVGGMSEESIAEDFLTGMMLHARGWKSVYVPEVLAEGLAPEDFLSYYKQQFRWARGALDVFGRGFFTRRGLTIVQKLQYLSSVSFYFSGAIVLMNAIIPLVFFFTGAVPLTVSTMFLAAVFLPYIFLTIYILQRSSNFCFTFRALTFSMGGFNIHLKAMWAAIWNEKSSFSVTPKKQQHGNFIRLVIPHLIYVAAAIFGMMVAYSRSGLTAEFVANFAWASLNIALFAPFIYAATPISADRAEKRKEKERRREREPRLLARQAKI